MLHVVGSTAEMKALLRQQESRMYLRPRNNTTPDWDWAGSIGADW
jgi:hypothetical protein